MQNSLRNDSLTKVEINTIVCVIESLCWRSLGLFGTCGLCLLRLTMGPLCWLLSLIREILSKRLVATARGLITLIGGIVIVVGGLLVIDRTICGHIPSG